MRRQMMFWAQVIPVVVLAVGGAVAGPQGDPFNLADLADGESRVFSAGEKTLTALRTGEAVTLSKADGTMLPACNLQIDHCTVSSDDVNIFMSIRREQNCEGDDCAEMEAAALPEGAHVMIRKHVRCEGDECAHHAAVGGSDHNVFVQTISDCDGDDCPTWVSENGETVSLGGAHAKFLVLEGGESGSCEGDGCPKFEFITSGNPAVVELMEGMSGHGAGNFVIFDRQSLIWKGADDVDGCPSGFRMMRYTDETAEDGFLCVDENGEPGSVSIHRNHANRMKLHRAK